MAAEAPTFVRRDGEILAFHEGQVIARGTNYSKVEESAVDYLEKHSKALHMQKENSRRQAATHIEGPGGMKGEILNNIEGPWGERQVTVRWSNGRITRHAAHTGDGLEYKVAEAESQPSALDYLQTTLNEVPEGTKESLHNRISVLDGLVVKAHAAQHTASYEDSKVLDDIAVQAQHEKGEVQAALAHLEASDAEAFAPPAPFHSSAVHQASLGGGDGSWLDDVSDQMEREAVAQDYGALLREGSVELVAELPTAVLAEAGATRAIAEEFIASKTAGLHEARGGIPGQDQGLGQLTDPGGVPGPAPAPMAAPPTLPAHAAPQAAPGAPQPNASPAGVMAQPAPGAPPNPNLQAPQGQQPPMAAPNQFLQGMQGFSSVAEFHDAFLANVEYARREELKDRQKEAKKAAKKAAKKQAKVEKQAESEGGDEALFL